MNCKCVKISEELIKSLHEIDIKLNNPKNIDSKNINIIKESFLDDINKKKIARCTCYIGSNIFQIQNWCKEYALLDKKSLTYDVKMKRIFDKVILIMYNIRNA